jgi:hypothetical protein
MLSSFYVVLGVADFSKHFLLLVRLIFGTSFFSNLNYLFVDAWWALTIWQL